MYSRRVRYGVDLQKAGGGNGGKEGKSENRWEKETKPLFPPFHTMNDRRNRKIPSISPTKLTFWSERTLKGQRIFFISLQFCLSALAMQFLAHSDLISNLVLNKSMTMVIEIMKYS